VPAKSRHNLIVDAGLADAAVVSGRPRDLVVAEFGRLAQISDHLQPSRKAPPWAQWEEDFVLANLGLLSLDTIGRHLGRSGIAIKMRCKHRGWPAPSRRPGWLTGHRAAKLLRVDGHAVVRWAKSGWLPHRRTPNLRQDIFINRQVLYQWALNPRNWLYFHPERVRDPHLRRLLELRRQRWGDEWWTTGQVAEWHGVHHTDVKRLIQRGRIRAIKWGNWRVLRSEALKVGLWFYRGIPGEGAHELEWSDDGDAFLVRSRAAGLGFFAIARMMGLAAGPGAKQLDYRLRCLRRLDRIPWLIAKYDLPVMLDPTTGKLSLVEALAP